MSNFVYGQVYKFNRIYLPSKYIFSFCFVLQWDYIICIFTGDEEAVEGDAGDNRTTVGPRANDSR